MIKSYTIICITAAVMITGCSPKLTRYPRDECRETPSQQVLKAVDDNCMMCHGKDFATPRDICARKALIIDSVSNGRMPKFGSLSKEEFLILSKWGQ